MPSHLHSDSPKSQHSRSDAANGRHFRRTWSSALAPPWLEDHHVRALLAKYCTVFRSDRRYAGDGFLRVHSFNVAFIDLDEHAKATPNTAAHGQHRQVRAGLEIDTTSQIQASALWPVGRAAHETRAAPAIYPGADYAP